MSTTTDPFADHPGAEYPFSISDIARATAKLLGAGWTAESGCWGTFGSVTGPYPATFGFEVDYEGDLCITYKGYETEGFAEQELPTGAVHYDDGVYLECASASDGLDHLAELSAGAIRAVTGYDPADFDFESTASRQHHAATGIYLRKGQTEAA